MEREGYGFTHEGKDLIRDRAKSSCEFPAETCTDNNNGIIHHITGVAEAKLDNKDKTAISDPTMNAIMLCDSHALQHDLQEQFQQDMLRAERWKSRGPNLHARRHVKNARHQRRRRR